MNDGRQAHWEEVYGRRAVTEVSWYEPRPEKSLELIRATGVQPSDPIIDVGGGASLLVDCLLDEGYRDLTVLDVSSEALEKLRVRLGARGSAVKLLRQDVTAFRPERRYALWHDRAVFHFLTQPEDRARYLAALRQALVPAGHLIIATFGPDGPERCSGLPVVRYSEQSLAAAIGADFSPMRSSLETHRTPAGASQQFLYCYLRQVVPTGSLQ